MLRRSLLRWGRTLLVVPAMAASLPSPASSLQISPILVSFGPDQPASAVTLQNAGDAVLNAQVRVFAWSQKDGEDVLEPDSSVQASPPIVAIPALGQQVVRLVRRAQQAPQRELSYRLLIDELPDTNGPTGNLVNFRLRYSVPMFVSPAGFPAPARLSWRLRRHDKHWLLSASNQGSLHAQLGSTRLHWPDGREATLASGLYGYALAGSTRSWELPDDLPAPVPGMQVQTTIDHIAVNADVQLEAH